MKNFLLSCILYIARGIMSFMYFFIKLFPMQKNKVTMLSRQSNEMNIDFEFLLDELEEKHKDIKVKVLCKKIPNGLLKKICYCFYIIKCLYHISTSKVCIVDGYSVPICSLKHKKGLIVIQIWHAMGAIKKFGKQVLDKNEGSRSVVAKIMKMHQNYTYITCTSEATREFYSEGFGIDKDKILTLGMPRIDYLLNKNNKIEEKVKLLLEHYPILKEKKTILYVPTFRKGNNTHIYDVINSVDTEKYNLIIRLHNLDNTQLSSKYTISKEYDTFELLKISDYVITDYSAVALEAAVLDKKTFFYLYDIENYKENRGLNINLQEEVAQNTSSKIQDIISKINNEQYSYEEQKKFKEKYIETMDSNNTERIIKYIVKLMEE